MGFNIPDKFTGVLKKVAEDVTVTINIENEYHLNKFKYNKTEKSKISELKRKNNGQSCILQPSFSALEKLKDKNLICMPKVRDEKGRLVVSAIVHRK